MASALFLQRPAARLRRAQALLLLLAAAVCLPAAAYAGFHNHPRVTAPQHEDAGRFVAAVLHEPATADDDLIGDYVLERFYVVDKTTGKHHVADLLKGRVKDVASVIRQDLGGFAFTLALDRSGLSAESKRLEAYIARIAPPKVDASAQYLGFKVQDGQSEIFLVNYNGSLPWDQLHVPNAFGPDVYAILEQRDIATVMPLLIERKGNNYLLSTTNAFPYFSAIFKVEKAVLLSELIFVDATTPEQVNFYSQIGFTIPIAP
jgi:hypothetical protein